MSKSIQNRKLLYVVGSIAGVMLCACVGCIAIGLIRSSSPEFEATQTVRAIVLTIEVARPTTTPKPSDTPSPTKTNTPTSTVTSTSISTPTPASTSTPTPTSPPTNTPNPTNTPKPTYTPEATATSTSVPTPVPTNTLAPANTPEPTNTSQAEAPPGSEILADGVWRCPNNTDGAAYVGSDQSDKFHYISCRWAEKIKDENRICFASKSAAIAYRYVACGTCKP
jgi:hypothetical protein